MTVSGIGSVEDGNVRVTLSGGETVSLEDVSFDSQETESLYYAASDYTTPRPGPLCPDIRRIAAENVQGGI